MKDTLYNRLQSLKTPELLDVRRVLEIRIEEQRTNPRHDYLGKCLIKATMELEKRGALPHRNNA